MAAGRASDERVGRDPRDFTQCASSFFRACGGLAKRLPPPDPPPPDQPAIPNASPHVRSAPRSVHTREKAHLHTRPHSRTRARAHTVLFLPFAPDTHLSRPVTLVFLARLRRAAGPRELPPQDPPSTASRPRTRWAAGTGPARSPHTSHADLAASTRHTSHRHALSPGSRTSLLPSTRHTMPHPGGLGSATGAAAGRSAAGRSPATAAGAAGPIRPRAEHAAVGSAWGGAGGAAAHACCATARTSCTAAAHASCAAAARASCSAHAPRAARGHATVPAEAEARATGAGLRGGRRR